MNKNSKGYLIFSSVKNKINEKAFINSTPERKENLQKVLSQLDMGKTNKLKNLK
jgi:hypothetical protein